MATETRGVQKLYAGWDAAWLRLRWQGFDARTEGDLYLYLGTGSGGTTDLYNPYGPGVRAACCPSPPTTWCASPVDGTLTLLSFSGGTWTVQAELTAQTRGGVDGCAAALQRAGIANPTAASLKLLGVASQPGALDVWATVPDRNLGRAWSQYVEFNSLGVGIVLAVACGLMPNWKSRPIRRPRGR